MTQRIILPLDHSTVSESALPLARLLSQQLGLPVTLVSVLHLPPDFQPYFREASRDPHPTPVSPASEKVAPVSPYGRWSSLSQRQPSDKQVEQVASKTREAEHYLKSIAETFPETMVETSVQYGNPAERILATAELRGNSIIVLASHGRSGLGKSILGSVASRVVQGASTPVFVVRARKEGADVEQPAEIQSVLVPVDGSDFSQAAIQHVQDVFGTSTLNLHLLYAIDDMIFAEFAHAEQYLEWLAEQISASGSNVTWEVRQGDADDEINRIASERDVDLIAMTTHGRSGIDRFVIGSVAERVLNKADKPLMMVRPQKRS